jgi:hypothetical protein
LGKQLKKVTLKKVPGHKEKVKRLKLGNDLLLKMALSQKRLEDLYISKVNIPNHYPEQKI